MLRRQRHLRSSFCGWTSGCWGERPARRGPRGSILGRRVVAHSVEGAKSSSLSVDAGAAAAAVGADNDICDRAFADGPPAPGASGRRGEDLGGRSLVAGLLRTAVRGLSRPLYPLMRVQRQRQSAPTTTSAIELLRMDLGQHAREAGAART